MTAPQTQVTLIDRLQAQLAGGSLNQRDYAVFDATYRPFLMALTSYLGRQRGLRAVEDEDVVQEILFDLYANGGLLKYQRIDAETGRERRLSTWLRMKVQTEVHTLARSKFRRARWETEDVPISAEPDAPTPISLAMCDEADPSQQVADAEQRAEDILLFQISRQRVLARRNAVTRQKVELYEQGLPAKKIAQRCGGSANACEVLLHDVRKAIAREMEDMRQGTELRDLAPTK